MNLLLIDSCSSFFSEYLKGCLVGQPFKFVYYSRNLWQTRFNYLMVIRPEF